MVIPDKRYENSLALNLSEPLDERTQNSTLWELLIRVWVGG